MSHTLPPLVPLISLGAFDGSPASPPPAGGRSLAPAPLPLVAARAAGLAKALVAEVVAVAAGVGEGEAGPLNQG